MSSLVGVYESLDKALSALKELKKSGFLSAQLSVISKADFRNNRVYVKANDKVERAEIGSGLVAGATLGILTGIGLFAIPGLGILYCAGALIGAIAGIEAGFLTGGIVAMITTVTGVDEARAAKYGKHLNEGKFLVFAKGDTTHIEHARHILHSQGFSLELNVH